MFARRQALAHPDKPAIVMASSGETVTFGDFEARSNRVAHLLRDAGLRRGDHIAVFIENSPQLLEIEGGAERAGGYYSLINTYLGADEVAYIVANSQAKVLFSSAARREVAAAAAAQSPGLARMLMTGPGPQPAGWESYDSVIIRYPTDPLPDESLGAAMLYSSGTTGQPKGVLRSLPDLHPDEPLPVMTFVRAMFGFREGMTYLNPAPLYHSAPQASVSAALRLGCTAIVWLAHPGTVGHPILGELLILDAMGNECPAGTDGTIWFRGATAFEYFRDPVKTAESRSHDGAASAVGDIGHVDADGYLYLTDRKSYMIISGGVNIYPQETENILSAHPAVQDVAVIGVPNDDLGEEVKAVVQLADPAAAGPELARDLIDFCRARLAHFKCPRTVDFVPELPRSETGKLYKRILRDAYWTGHQSSIG